MARGAGKPQGTVLNRFYKDEVRYARRMARIARWDRPIASAQQRLKAWFNMLVVDHGLFRLVYPNRFRVAANLWRSSQPAPHDIHSLARRGLRTVVNLRGGREYGSWPLEREACEQVGVRLAEFVVRSREAPTREGLIAARDLFASMQYPALVHCKSGADRAGFAAALYLLMVEKRPLDEAARQLSLLYGHFPFAKTGILDAFFEAYRREGEAKGLDFMTWIDTVYDPEKLQREFKPRILPSFFVDRVLGRE
jgi:protein tyrosine phosphatase (PTP) superfamily phosphohydrolase (DUF442 family)